MIPVVDAHHHIWRQDDLPWLKGPMVPRIFGPYEPIRRDYPIDEYLADIAGTGVEKSVYVQTNWAPEKAEDEVAWVQKTADESGWPHAIVGYADLLAEDARPALDRLKTYPLVRGIRMQLHWHANEQYRFAKRPDLVDDPTFRRNFSALARVRPFVRPAGLRRPDARRGPARVGFPRDDVHPAARRHAGGHLGNGEARVASGDARACDAAERRHETLRTRHLHPQERPGACRVDRQGDGGDLRRRPLPFRLEFSRSRSCGPTIRRSSTRIAPR